MARTNTPGINSWRNMLKRCEDPRHRNYKDYGGRGIKVCERWRGAVDGFENFMADMGPLPSPEHSVGRIENDKGYWPENCRWETYAQQARNSRRNVWVTAFGETAVLNDMCRKYGMDMNTVKYRLRQGWTTEEALTKPLHAVKAGLNRWVTAFGNTKHLAEWCRERGLNQETVAGRLDRGWEPERALSQATAKTGQKRLVEAFGRSWLLTHLCKHYGVTRSVVARRIEEGMSAEEAVNASLGTRINKNRGVQFSTI